MIYEALNNCSGKKLRLVIVLNDNGMSIDPNVGAMPSHLGQLRSKPAYYHFKKWYRGLFGENPMENGLYRFNHRVKTALKKTLWPRSTLFEDMGFTYMGPIDGHDQKKLELLLSEAKQHEGCSLIHVKTVKGKGYAPAEEHPDVYHGIPPKGSVKSETFSEHFGSTLCTLAKKEEGLCAITAAMAGGTGLSSFAKDFPDRFFDVGIAEEHALTFAAGNAYICFFGLSGSVYHATHHGNFNIQRISCNQRFYLVCKSD